MGIGPETAGVMTFSQRASERRVIFFDGRRARRFRGRLEQAFPFKSILVIWPVHSKNEMGVRGLSAKCAKLEFKCDPEILFRFISFH